MNNLEDKAKFDILEWAPVFGLFRVKDNINKNKKTIVTEDKDLTGVGALNYTYHLLTYLGGVITGIVYLGSKLTN